MLPNLCYNMVVLALLITTVVLSATTLGRVEEVSTCRLRYEGDANDLTEQQFQVLAKQQGWTLTHPEPPDCNRCGLNVDQGTNDVLYPVWLAPVDICNVFGLSPTHPLCDRATYQLPQSHVKVCATQTQINEVWAAGGCHRTNATDGSERPIVGYDGNLFCKDPTTKKCGNPFEAHTCWVNHKLGKCEYCYCELYDTVVDKADKKECQRESLTDGSKTAQEVTCPGGTLEQTTNLQTSVGSRNGWYCA